MVGVQPSIIFQSAFPLTKLKKSIHTLSGKYCAASRFLGLCCLTSWKPCSRLSHPLLGLSCILISHRRVGEATDGAGVARGAGGVYTAGTAWVTAIEIGSNGTSWLSGTRVIPAFKE